METTITMRTNYKYVIFIYYRRYDKILSCEKDVRATDAL